MRMLLVAFCLILSSCVFKVVEKGLTDLQGQPVQTAFDVIGYPSSKMEIGEDTVYYWGNSFSRSLVVPQVQNTYGTLGTTPFQMQTNSFGVINQQHSGEIKIIADKKGMIKTWEYNGTEGGLMRYARPLEKYSKRRKAMQTPL